MNNTIFVKSKTEVEQFNFPLDNTRAFNVSGKELVEYMQKFTRIENGKSFILVTIKEYREFVQSPVELIFMNLLAELHRRGFVGIMIN